MRRPLVWLTIIYCLGILTASLVRLSFLSVYSLIVIFFFAGLLSLKKELIFNISLFCLVFLLGIALAKNAQILPKRHISKYLYHNKDKTYAIKGVINSQPIIKFNKTAFVLKTKEIQLENSRQNCCGNILVYIKGAKDFKYADELVLNGTLHRPFGFRVSNRKGYRNYLYNQGIWAIMNARTASLVASLNKNRLLSPRGFALWLKSKMEELIFKYGS